MRNLFKKKLGVLALGSAVSGVFVGSAFAQEASKTSVDYSKLIEAVDWASVITTIMAIGGSVAALYVVWVGIKIVLRAIKSA